MAPKDFAKRDVRTVRYGFLRGRSASGHGWVAGAEGELLSVAGLFSKGEAAGAYVAELKGVGFDAKARSEVRTLGPWRWLEVADAVTEERQNLLRGIEWGDAKAQVAGVPCS